MKYASVCSGIEAATVAWKALGWKAEWLSEIEEFPSSVLAHHYPETPNLGDMTKLKGNKIYEQSTFNVLVGGTPCQAFSIAGLRGGLSDQRSNLALEYCRILIDKQPKWFVWENVPGVFSSFSDAEGSDLTGGDGGERGSGDDITQSSDFATLLTAFRECGYSCAWRVFDSRYFGVPQRRRRVFVVGHIGGDWRPPVAVLFERQSLSRDFTPSGSKRKRTPKGTEGSTGVGSINCKPDGISGAMTSKWAKGTGGPAGDEHYNLIVTPSFGIQGNIVDRSEKSGANGLGVKEEEAFTLTKGDRQCVMQPIVIDRAAFNQVVNAKYDAQIEYSQTAPCLVKVGPHAVMTQPVVYDTTQLTCPTYRSNPQQGDPCHTLAKGGDAPLLIQPTVCYIDVVGRGLQANDELAPTAVKFWGTGEGNVPFVQQPAMVRRLTPLECCRLQGFPDNFMAGVPNATDAKWYAALGNSMTVNVMKWIGERIDKVDKLMEKLNNQ
jgi:DNA (cytosine-5)-methyltransferase 1